jgi:CHASE3 domain sensor protein
VFLYGLFMSTEPELNQRYRTARENLDRATDAVEAAVKAKEWVSLKALDSARDAALVEYNASIDALSHHFKPIVDAVTTAEEGRAVMARCACVILNGYIADNLRQRGIETRRKV